MSKNKTTIEEGIINPTSFKRKLWNLRFRFILPSIIWTIIYLLLNGTNFFDWEYDWVIFIIVIIVPTLGNIISNYRPDCIYKFDMEDRNVNLFLMNIFGMKESISISQDEVCTVEYSDRKLWIKNGKIWIHFEKRVEEYSLIDNRLGKELKDKLDLGKN